MGTEDVKVTAMNMYKYKEGLRFYKRCYVHVFCKIHQKTENNVFNTRNEILCTVYLKCSFQDQSYRSSIAIIPFHDPE